MDVEDTNPWFRREKETPRAYEAFSQYLLMASPRNISALKATYKNANNWSCKFDWRERAAAFDQDMIEKHRTTKVDRLALAQETINLAAHELLSNIKDKDSDRQALTLSRVSNDIRKALGFVEPRNDIIGETPDQRGTSNEAARRIQESQAVVAKLDAQEDSDA